METTLDSDQQKITPMSVGDWVITFLITAIPFVNFIMLFVWAFGDGNKKIEQICIRESRNLRDVILENEGQPVKPNYKFGKYPIINS